MEITEVRVFPVSEERLKAYVTITFDNCFVVRDLKMINGNAGLFVAMPAKRRKDGTFKDIAHPLNSETRERMEKIILAEYEREIARVATPAAAAGCRAPARFSRFDPPEEAGRSAVTSSPGGQRHERHRFRRLLRQLQPPARAGDLRIPQGAAPPPRGGAG